MLYQALNRDVFRLKNSKIPSDAVGIEVEMEFTKSFEPRALMENTTGWVAKSDGSLRNFGVEFVSQPTPMKTLDVLMDQWGRLLKEGPMQNRIDGCPRASVHVHTNVRDYTYNQLMNIIVAYTILEGVMVTFCGKYRRGNLFALRIPEAPYIFDSLRKANKEYDVFTLNSEMRYSALNLASLRTFGTLEFRSFGSNYAASDIDLWVRGVRRLVDHAASFTNPPAVYERYVALTKPQFIREFLGTLGEEILRRHEGEVEERLNDGEEYAIAFLSSHPDNWAYTSDFRDDGAFREWYNKQSSISPLYATSMNYKNFQTKDSKPLVFDPNLGFAPDLGTNIGIGELPVDAFRTARGYETYIRERMDRAIVAQRAGTSLDEFNLLRWVWANVDISTTERHPDTGQTWRDWMRDQIINQPPPPARAAPRRTGWVTMNEAEFARAADDALNVTIPTRPRRNRGATQNTILDFQAALDNLRSGNEQE